MLKRAHYLTENVIVCGTPKLINEGADIIIPSRYSSLIVKMSSFSMIARFALVARLRVRIEYL